MAVPPPEPVSLSARVHAWLAVPIAVLASALATLCLVSGTALAPALDELGAVDQRVAGWAGVGAVAGIASAAVVLLSAGRLGAGPGLSLGAAAAVFGLALGNGIADDVQLALAQVMLGVAVGGLLGGTAAMTLELLPRTRRAVVLAFTLPLAIGWPVLAMAVSAGASADRIRLTVHPPVELLAPVSAAIVMWSSLSLLVEPPRSKLTGEPGWDTAWTALLASLGAGAVTVMLLGFGSDAENAWLRPLVVALTGAVLLGLAATTLTIPRAEARAGYLAASYAALLLPVDIALLVLVADAGERDVPPAAVAVLMGVGCLGALVGWRWPRTMVAGALIAAGASVGAWVMPDTAPWMLACTAPLVLGLATALAGGLSAAASTAMGWRLVTQAVIGVLLLTAVIAVPVGWSLAGDIGDDLASARATGRIFLGVTFSAGLLVAAAAAVSWPRDRRPARAARTSRWGVSRGPTPLRR